MYLALSSDRSHALFSQLSNAASEDQLPPVDSWNPPYCGEIDMHIRQDGTWYYGGTPFTRERMVRLFARVLKREGDDFYLVTPVEKVKIRVDDAPFVIVDMDQQWKDGQSWWVATTNVGDRVVLDSDHRLWVETNAAGESLPYIHVRSNLNGRLTRSVFYRLVDDGHERDDGDGKALYITSGPLEFVLGRF